MTKNIEVELRGPLPKKKYEEMKAFFEENGRDKLLKNRIVIDYTTCIEGEILRDRNLDIRARITNGTPEMIIRVGKWQGSDVRKEISVLLQNGQFSNLVRAFGALGYKKGVLCVRNILVYNYDGIEFALVEVPGHSYLFEAEVLVSSENEIKPAQEKIKNKCNDLSLELFSDADYFNYIEVLNSEANKIFDIEVDGDDYFAKKYNI